MSSLRAHTRYGTMLLLAVAGLTLSSLHAAAEEMEWWGFGVGGLACTCKEYTMHIAMCDVDGMSGNMVKDDMQLTGLDGWTLVSSEETEFCTIMRFTHAFDTAGEYDVPFTIQDANKYDNEDDTDITYTCHFLVVDTVDKDPPISVAEISGVTSGQAVRPGKPLRVSVVARDDDTVVGCGATKEQECTYSWTATGGSFQGGVTGSSATWIPPCDGNANTYEISVWVDDKPTEELMCDGGNRDDNPVTKSRMVAVSSVCEAAGCSGSGNEPGDGGCMGSCNIGADAFPLPGIKDMHPEANLPGGSGGFGAASMDSGSCSAGFETVQCGNSVLLIYRDCNGHCTLVSTTTSGTGPYTFPDGTVATQSGSNPATAAYTLASPNGTVSTYNAPPSDQANSAVRTPLLASITDPDGRATTFSRTTDGSGSLNSVTLPNGDEWTYLHENGTGDRRITRATAPDGQRTDVTYVQSGPALGEIATVSIYGSDSTLLKSYTYTYDAAGRLSTASDGTVTTVYEYSASAVRVSQVDTATNPDTILSITDYTYGNGSSDATTVTRRDPEAPTTNYQTTTYQFFTMTIGAQTIKTHQRKVTDPMGKETTYSTYVASGTNTNGDCTVTANQALIGKVYDITDALSNDTQYSFNADGTLNSVTHPDTSTEVYEYYTGTRWLRTVKNVRGNYTYYKRNPNAMHQVQAIKVNSANLNDTGWNSVASIKEFAYYPSNDAHNQKGLVERETVPDIDGSTDKITSYEYWETVNSETKLRNGPTRTTYQWWDASLQTPAYVDKTSATSYDSGGRAVLSTDANNRSIGYTYDNRGRPYQTIYQASGGNPTVYTQNNYDCCHLQSARDENGHLTHYAYDLLGRATKTWTDISGQSEGSALVEYEYDGFGNVHYVRTWSDASTVRTTEYLYDGNNRVFQINHPTGLGSEYFQYDDVGNLIAKKDGAGVVTAYEYDGLNRLVAVKYGYGSNAWPAVITGSLSNPDVTYAYDGGSRLRTSMTDSTGTSSYTYDAQGRLLTYTPPAPTSRLVEYGYNALGQKTSLTLSNNNTPVLSLGYEYYANGWLKKVTNGTTPYAAYQYDAVGNRTRVDLNNNTGAYTTYAYATVDPRYLLETIGHYDRSDTQLLAIGYARDSAGNPTSIGNEDYTYDANNRLDSQTGVEDWNYDWVGNRVNPPASPNPMVYNAADQLTSWPGQHTYDYLGTGSLYHQYDSTGQTVQETYTYTAANLLESVVHAGIGTSSMTWDADGNRVSFTSSEDSGTTQFVYDTTAGIPAVIEEVLPSTSSVHYIREPNGSLIARVAGANTRYYHFDALGSTKLLTDSTGAVTDKYTYDAWGNTTHDTGSLVQPYQYIGALGYYTHYQDENLPMLQLGVRFYDPAIGGFSQVDPVPSELSAYVYVSDNPISYFDPSGRSPELDKARKCRDKALISCGGSAVTNPFGDESFLECYAKKFMQCMGGSFLCEPYFCQLFPNSQYCTSTSPKNPCMRDQSDKMNCGNCCGVKHECCLLISAAKGSVAWEACRHKHTGCVIDCECGKK